jgi:hypothetical protein
MTITKDKFDDIMKALEPTINQALFLSGNEIKNAAKSKFKKAVVVGLTSSGKKKYKNPQPLNTIHDRTGFLRISIQASDPKDFQITVGTPLNYGLYNELGGANLPARPFMKPSAYENIPKINKIFTTLLNDKIKAVVQ